jgi:O-antigen/teichoic acid export membrane protein
LRIFKSINLRGDLFATGLTFGAQGVIKISSSLVLTRILRPEAYGVVTIIMSILFVVEMIGDLGLNLFVIRDPNGETSRFLNTAWTLRLARATLNTLVVLLGARLIASIYGAPELVAPLRIMSVGFLISALASMSFPIAIRRKRARIIVYSELAAQFVSTIFSIIYCYFSRDFWGLIYGFLLNNSITTVISYLFFKDLRPRIYFDRQAAKEVMRFTKYSTPSSLLTLALSQFDKIVFIKFFDLRLLGLYGLGSNMAAPFEGLISKISQMVLYPRCAHDFREHRDSFAMKYYTENNRLLASILVLPPLGFGAAHVIVSILYPARYLAAETVFRAFMLRAMLLSLASPSEDLLIAAGEPQVILVGNIARAVWMVLGSILGYYAFGFLGFIYGMAMSGLPPLVYYFWLQHRLGFLIPKYEFRKVTFVAVLALCSYIASGVFWYALKGPR